MANGMDTQVLIVGAGPTGLTLALDLGRRGVRCTIIEQKEAPQFLPKMERVNARSMEIYRRIGIADRIRAAGLPSHCPMDVFIVLSVVEPPLLHLPYPSVDQARARIAATNDGSEPLEPYQLISQYTLEPLLKSIIEQLPSVTVRYGHEFLSFTQDADSVIATVKSGGKTSEIKAQYLVGCDGGSSLVRRQLGIGLAGDSNLLQLRQALYRCDDLYERIPIGKGRHYHVADAQSTFLIVQDSTRHFTLHSVVETDADMATMFERTVAMPVKYDMLYVGQWRQNLLLADSYGQGRVFLAGDAVHLVIPTGGLGMNSGVGDAIDLSWKLAAVLQGWGGPAAAAVLRDRAPADRRAQRGGVAPRHRRAPRLAAGLPPEHPRRHAGGRRHPREPHSHRRRRAAQEQRDDRRRARLPLCRFAADLARAGEGPEHNFMDYVPTTWPGARLPHVWLDDGTAMQDRIGYGDGYTLLRLGGTRADTAALERAFGTMRAPFQMLDVPDAAPRDVYGHDLLLLRPDMHVVWRGNALPPEPAKLAALATGH